VLPTQKEGFVIRIPMHFADIFLNKLRGLWRLYRGLRPKNIRSLAGLPRRSMRFCSDWRHFRSAGGSAWFRDIAPVVCDLGTATQSGGGQYFYQDVWALRRLARFGPAEHHDFGSRLDGFSGQATAICPIFYYDIRRPKFALPGLNFREADLRALPLDSASVQSISCLHVAEHIGLGRYGDKIDPLGTDKALIELARVLAPAGQLLFSMPIGRERVEFNAQRIWHPLRIIAGFQALRLEEFSVVTDDDIFIENARPEEFSNQNYACGLYLFRR
jgi:SAM-dependent methyltransferase